MSLLGSNGAGKSTLLGCVTNSVPCRMTGSIKLDGDEHSGIAHRCDHRARTRAGPRGTPAVSRADRRGKLANGRLWLRPRAEVALGPGASPTGCSRSCVERRRQPAATLSGGEQQMVAIGRALMARPGIMLLDEPSLGLAPMLVKEIFDLIREINRAGRHRAPGRAERPPGAAHRQHRPTSWRKGA